MNKDRLWSLARKAGFSDWDAIVFATEIDVLHELIVEAYKADLETQGHKEDK
jgi:hypothetical protein